MSILTDLENYLNSKPDEDLFELIYTLGQYDQVVDDFIDDEYNVEEDIKILNEMMNKKEIDTRWFDMKEGRREAFVNYVRDKWVKRWEQLKNE